MSGTLARTMPRQATGSIETHRWRDGKTVSFRARFRAYGRRWRIDFGTNHEGWSEERARVELERIMGQVARGTWEPPAPETRVEFDRDETVHVTASRWWQRRESELCPNTKLDYRWRLTTCCAPSRARRPPSSTRAVSTTSARSSTHAGSRRGP